MRSPRIRVILQPVLLVKLQDSKYYITNKFTIDVSFQSLYSVQEKRARFCKIDAFRSPFCRWATFWLYMTSSIIHACTGQTAVVPLGCACMQRGHSDAVMTSTKNMTSQPNVVHDREWHLWTADLAEMGLLLPCALW